MLSGGGEFCFFFFLFSCFFFFNDTATTEIYTLSLHDALPISDIYTKYMGGVDRADQLRSYYYIERQSRKWYKYLFWFAFNVAACNSYILQCENTRRKRPQEKFLLELGKGLIAGFNSRKRASASAAVQDIRPK